MKVFLALAVLVFVSQAHGFSSGQAVSVGGKTTKVCQDCLNFFTDLQQMVSSANTTAQIEQLLDQMICSQMGSLEGMCKDLISQYVPLFLKYLASEEDPRQICGLLGMCTQEALKLVAKPAPRKQLVKGEECDLCKEAVNELKDLVRDPNTQAAIKNFIENQVCPLLGSLQVECKQEVENYATLVFELLENELDAVAVCQTLGLCTQMKMMHLSRVGLSSSVTNVKVFTTKKKVKDSAECVACEFVMNELDQILGNNRTQASIEAALDKVCSLLPTTVQDECKNLVDTYGPMIINLLLQEISPKEVCTQLGLCTQVKRADPDPACLLCEFVVSELDTLIGNNKSQQSVEAAMKKVCDMMPVTISAECREFVTDYGASIINLLVKELDPPSVCKTLRLCTSKKAVKVMPIRKVQKKVGASPECLICEFAMKELDTLLTDNMTKTELMNALDKVCSLLPSTVRDQCVTFVNTYTPAILELLIQEIDPDVICTALGLCSQKNVKKAMPLKLKASTEGCDLCVTVLNYVAELMKENDTEHEVQLVLDKVCNFLPDQIKTQCIQFVKDYTPLVLDLIGNDLDPRQICEQIGLCNASRKAMELRDNRLYLKGGLLGKDKCTFGPSFWCETKENAVLCGTVEHCQKHVWN